MKTIRTRRFAALIALACAGLAAPAFAQDKTIKIGVLNDMSSLYADIGGPNSVLAVKMAVDAKGNVYAGEVDTGKRIQKFKLTSDALR